MDVMDDRQHLMYQVVLHRSEFEINNETVNTKLMDCIQGLGAKSWIRRYEAI